RRPGRPRNQTKTFEPPSHQRTSSNTNVNTAHSSSNSDSPPGSIFGGGINWHDLEDWQGLETGTFDHLLSYSATQEEMPRVGSNLLTSPTSNPSGSSFPLSDPLSSTTGLPDALLPPASHDNTTNDLDFNRDPTLATSFPATSRSISNVSRDRLNVLTNSISPHALSTTSLLTPSGSAASSISSSSTSLITPAAPAMISPKDHISFDTLTRTCTDLQQLQKQLEENRS
ncbi:MAG: hypothetical protein Q9162_005645, partial [Coniocarpon cinnabarinum]